MGRGVVGSFLKTTTDYDKSLYGTSSNSQEAIVTQFGLEPVYHRCFDSLGRQRWCRTTSLLHKSCLKGYKDPLPHNRKGMLGNSLHIAKTMTLFLGLRDTFDNKVPCNQSSSSTTYSLWKDITMVVTIVAIWLEDWNTQGGEKSSHSKPAGPISRRRGIFARWWGFRRNGHNRSNRKAMGHEVQWLFYSKLEKRKSGPL